jgi:hypothetical protein
MVDEVDAVDGAVPGALVFSGFWVDGWWFSAIFI